METKPNYEEIVGPLGKQVDNLFMSVFRTELVRQVGFDSDRPKTDYQGIIEVAFDLNRRYSDRVEIQRRAQETLRALFPSWLPGSYAKLFSKPFPEVRDSGHVLDPLLEELGKTKASYTGELHSIRFFHVCGSCFFLFCSNM